MVHVFLFLNFYVLIWERKTASAWAGSPTWGSILGPRDHDLSQRQMFHWDTRCPSHFISVALLWGKKKPHLITSKTEMYCLVYIKRLKKERKVLAIRHNSGFQGKEGTHGRTWRCLSPLMILLCLYSSFHTHILCSFWCVCCISPVFTKTTQKESGVHRALPDYYVL